ncbi:iron ABC transporter permease [Brevundimonas sp.]|uniref:FecCD family ABC transporter permease n=1 Tax=Brevundimonas sp. TaxID=1871086 RepID=UPI0025E65327|nr:iron ABC transporter permease [Brevundimonas sp.]
MTGWRLNGGLAAALLLATVAAVVWGETALTADQYLAAFTTPSSPAAEVLWAVRAPRAVVAGLVGAALGLSGALLQGLLRNPLADPGVLGVSATAAFGAALAIVLGLALTPGLVEFAAWLGAGAAGLALAAFAARFREPEALILFGVALSSFFGAATALIFNLSPSPVATAEVLSWLMGSVEARSWGDVLWAAPALAVALFMALKAAPALRMLTLGEDAAAASGLEMERLKLTAVLAASLATGAAVAMAGVIGFVGLAAPHLVRAAVKEDAGRLLAPAAIAGALILVLADLLARITPTDQELKLGVFTALIGAPLFALIALRAARSWRT